jgi:hypothetical protein
MARKATEQVTTIGIDIGKNSLHLIGLEDCLGSIFRLSRCHRAEGNPEGKGRSRTLAKGKSAFRGRLPVTSARP